MATKVPTEQLIRDRVRSLPRRIRPEAADGLVAEWELRVGPQSFAITVQDHACSVSPGPASAPATVITADPGAWLAIDEGRLNGGDAFFAGTLRADDRGDVGRAANDGRERPIVMCAGRTVLLTAGRRSARVERT